MNIYQKLAKVKAKIGAIQKDATNPFYKSKYFDINSLLHQLEPLLHEQGLIVLQPICDGSVCTQIVDTESENKIESCMALPNLDDPQKMGSAITYYRRYSLQSLLSLQADDDDGNLASNVKEEKPKNDNPPITEWLSEEQFNKTLEATQSQIKAVLDKYDGYNGKGMKKEYRQALVAKLRK